MEAGQGSPTQGTGGAPGCTPDAVQIILTDIKKDNWSECWMPSTSSKPFCFRLRGSPRCPPTELLARIPRRRGRRKPTATTPPRGGLSAARPGSWRWTAAAARRGRGGYRRPEGRVASCAVDADGKTGDGAGLHVELPQDFFRDHVRDLAGELPHGRPHRCRQWRSCRAPILLHRNVAVPSSRPRPCALAIASWAGAMCRSTLGDRREGR